MRRHARVGITHPLLLKDGEVFFVSDAHGRIEPPSGLGLGLFYRDCRYLAHYALMLGDTDPVILAASADAGFVAALDLTNLEFHGHGGVRIAEHALAIAWRRSLHAAWRTLQERIAVRNCCLDRVGFDLRLLLEARFEAIFMLRGQEAKRRGTLHAPAWEDDGTLRFRYDGADGVQRLLDIAVSPVPPPPRIKGASAEIAVPLDLAPQATAEVTVTLAVHEAGNGEPPRPAPPSRRAIDENEAQVAREWFEGYATPASDDARLDAVLTRALADIRLLTIAREDGRFIAAGVPWFVALFGRDSVVPSLQCLAFNPDLAAHTLRALARRQGDRYDAERQEQPGKILHELRVGEMAHLGEVPQRPGYGAIDSTILYLVAMARHAQWSGTTALFEELRGTVDRALGWLARDADADQDGYVDYDNGTAGEPKNQGWKDSADAVTYPDGSLVRGRIALTEVQGYAYLAKTLLAELCRRVGDGALADRLASEAAVLRARFNRDFWMEEEGCYCSALDRAGQQVRVVSSNPGQALWTGIVDADKAVPTARRLMAPDMFSGWGVRTLSERAGRFNPIGYHTGGVWPFDNALILAGLKRYGCDAAALQLFEATLEAALHFDLLRLPEFFSGAPRRPGSAPARCPRADPLQAWSAGAVPMMLVALLGLEADGFERRLRIVRPLLPIGTNRLELRGLRVGAASVDLGFTRRGADIEVETLRQTGELEVRIE